MDAVTIVKAYLEAVWKGRNPDAIDTFVADDFVLTLGGLDIIGREHYKDLVRQFLTKIEDFEYEIIEVFQNADGSRVAVRWCIRGRNNGLFGTASDRRKIAFTGNSIWAVRPDGKLLRQWVERSGLFSTGLASFPIK